MRRAAAAAVVLACLSATTAVAAHMTGHREPTGPAPMLFAEDFDPPLDHEYEWPLGGFGGIRRGAPLKALPIVFVHGNQGDAQSWYVVRDQLREEFGYTDQELWALSYAGLGYVGGTAPTEDAGEADYVAEHPQAGLYGNPQNNDVNVGDMLDFIAAVRDYTGAPAVQVVAHSLGVTLIRKAMLVEPALREQVEAVVGIAGANQGTSVCRGIEGYYGCDELVPGSAWLAELNAAGQALGPTRWMTVYDGTGAGDVYYRPEDAKSPALEGADNREYPNTTHNDLRVHADIVRDWMAFLQEGAALPAPPSVEVEQETSGTADEPEAAPMSPPASQALPATGGTTRVSLAIALMLLATGLASRRRRPAP